MHIVKHKDCLKANIDRKNRTVDIYKIVGNEIMSDTEYLTKKL